MTETLTDARLRELILDRIKASGKSLNSICLEAGLRTPTVSSYLKGGNTSVSFAVRIAEAVGIKLLVEH